MKIKSLATVMILSLAAALSARAADDGDILEFRPITETVSAANAYGASTTIKFTMRLLPEGYENGLLASANNWEIYYKGAGSTNLAWAVTPLQLGIVVSGQTRGADLDFPVPCAKGDKFTDIVCTYVTKFGDYAMPLKLAGDGNGNAAGDNKASGFDPSVSGKYFFINDNLWGIRDAVTGRELKPYRRQNVNEVPESPVNGSYDLGENFGGTGLAYYVKTVDFDEVRYEGKNPYDSSDETEYWRVVNENATTCRPGDPTIVVSGLPTNPQDLFMYVWSENPDAVVLPNGEKHTFKGPDGVEREYLVEKIQIVENDAEYSFRLRGVTRSEAATIVMAPQIGYRFDGAGDLIEDYRSVKVLCIDPPEPTISAVLSAAGRSESSYICSTNYAVYVDTLRVTLTQPTNVEMKVKLEFKCGDTEGFPTNIIAVSSKNSGGYLEDNLLDGMIVTIPANELSSPDYYVYALGASKSSATPPGITVTPVAEAEYASYLKNTNSCYMIVKGMNPVVVSPLGTAEAPAAKVTVRGNSPREFTVEILDSYRNLYYLDGSNDYYTVTWDRGVGSVLSITNDINGGPLVPDEYGRLRFNVTYPATTNTYVSSFSVRNPEGLASAQSFILVETLQPATVTAETADGEVSLVESDKVTYNIRFRLSDINDAMDAGKLYAFLEPANEAASNRCDAAFMVKQADGQPGIGVPFDMVGGIAFTGLGEGEAYEHGGLKVLDGDNVSQPKFNVVLCTSETYSDATRFNAYASTPPLNIGLLNATPAVTRLRLKGSSSYVRYSGATSAVVRLNDPRELSIIAWNTDTEVAKDLFAEAEDQIVLRWRIYEIPEDGDENVEPYDVFYTVGTNSVCELPGFDIEGMKKVVVQVQDKDMRNDDCVQQPDGTGWKYVMDPADPEHDWWEDDDNSWGEEFVVYVPVNDKPVVNVSAVGGVSSLASADNNVFSESQLPPYSIVADPNMGLLVTLSEKFDEGKVKVVLTVKGEDVDGGFLTLGVTNLTFQKNAVTSGSKTMNVPIVDFDGTWRGGSSNKGYAHYVIEARVVDSGAADELYNAGECDVYVANVEPNIYVESKFADCVDASNAWEVAKNERVTINWTVEDIEPDMTNAMVVSCTVKGGQIDGESTITSSPDVSVANGSFTVYFSESGYNYALITATDKDGNSSETRVYFHIESSKNLFLYPSKPSSSAADSTEISDYLQASGIGFGRVWADGALAGIEYFMHTWTYGPGATTAFAFADGYTAGETDNSDAFVTVKGDHSTTDNKYTSPLAGLDSFFYRWFARVAGESGGDSEKGSWTAYTPNPQVSKEDTAAAAATRLQLSLPGEAKELVYADTSAMAIFAREYIPSDNLGDINRDGIPDVYVIKYKLSAGSYDAGADLVDFSAFGEGGASGGEGENADSAGGVDLLPSIVPSAYSSLIPGVFTGEFTAKLEIRGFDDNLNDATATQFPDGTFNNATVDGAKPERKYTDPRTDPDSTLSLAEYLAWSEFLAVNAGATVDNWSPERPTDPTRLDTDGDGFADGFEYAFWYMAHVGYIDGAGNHKRLTGRVFDPRNPGHGRRISSEEVARMMDPLTPFGSAAQANTRDTDNDGLPDVLEALIGTNPIDFDSDGDGLPDGWELMMAGTDPLLTHSALDAKLDTERNYDGDAMAYTTPKLEEAMMPTPNFIQKLVSFAAIDPSGDSDGVQWYVVKEGDEGAITYTLDETGKGTLLTVGDEKYIVEGKVVVTPENRVASDLEGKVFKAVAAADAASVPGITAAAYLRLAPAVIERGTLLSAALEEDVGYAVAKFATVPEATRCNAAWIYGNANLAGYGALAVGRYQLPEVGAVLCELPDTERDVAYIHSLVYQEYGFDPRTAWSPETPLTARWGSTSSDGAAIEGVYKATQGGYVSRATRTREYAAYDEFLVYSFFLNNGTAMSGETYITDKTAPQWALAWSTHTTNPQGPNEPGLVNEENYFGRNSVNGADTDQDGVPDGWELYVMAGPKYEGKYVFAPAWEGFAPALGQGAVTEKSHWSPFVGDAAKNVTDNQIYLGGQANSDGLSQLREYAGTDSCAYYSTPAEGNELAFSTTVVRPAEDAKWLNKFMPTDPWAADTDLDGVMDGAEGGAFVYGTPADNGKLWAIPGGGLNPCTVDTDLDGLPDPWELQYKGSTVYAGEDADYASGTADGEKGNPLQGFVDGMDGTVFDSYTVPHNFTHVANDGRIRSGKVNRDYDRDGLENWQEYMTGTMRCWRYDDPFTGWFAVPVSSYFVWSEELGSYIFDIEVAKKAMDVETEDEFWYNTLVNRDSGFYNPYFICEMSSGNQYFSRVDNGWDLAFMDAGLDKAHAGGAYYFFYDRIGATQLKKSWGPALGAPEKAPTKYMGTSPLKADSDQDGLDDYYELFHGMNPLLGESGVTADGDMPCDLVADAWHTEADGIIVEAWNEGLTANFWTRKVKAGDYYRTGKKPRGNGYDFEYYPWLNGVATADPDGDDIRNQIEGILPNISVNSNHTDPTPLWMTDSSYSNSLTRMFFRMPARFTSIELAADGFTDPTDPEKKYYFRDFAGYQPAKGLDPAYFGAVSPDVWQLAADGEANWMFSFEENEGYDTDHDGISDSTEKASLFRGASDPNDFDSPRRRQAMYFGGAADPSVLQTVPEEKEDHPLFADTYPQTTEFNHYTVECWVKPETLDDATIVERAIRSDISNPGDQRFVRCNFRLAVKNGKWYTKYDTDGTVDQNYVEVFGAAAVTEWTHLAATYDGKALKLYVNGTFVAETASSSNPEHGDAVYYFDNVSRFWGSRRYPLIATVVGASVKSAAGDNGKYGPALAVTSDGALAMKNLSAYENFFQGYIDEIRIWDGDRTSDEIAADYRVRYTSETAAANREAVFAEWKEGNRQSVAGNTARAELRAHYAFDSVFGALESDAQSLRRTPEGFNDNAAAKPPLSRPEDWSLTWLKDVYEAQGSAYASDIWATWVPNTLAHLPRFDGTTLDSYYWSADFEGDKLGKYDFPMSAEPYSKWTQMFYNSIQGTVAGSSYQTPGARYSMIHLNPDAQEFATSSNETYAVDYLTRFEFTARSLNQQGDDMIILGGAFAKYSTDMWDDQGATDPWEYTGKDANMDGIPDWWSYWMLDLAHGLGAAGDPEYEFNGVSQNLSWNDIVVRNGQEMTLREAYLRDLAAGVMRDTSESDSDGVAVNGEFAQIADANGDGLADWWERLHSLEDVAIADDTDNDGLNDFAEYLISETFAFAELDPRSPRSDGKRLDYFRKLGSVYFGEVLSDHDMMEDWWESLYPIRYISSGIYDAHVDSDGDGWSNFAECRFGSSPARISYLGVDSTTMNDFPTPIIKLNCTYNGAQNAAVYPVVVKAYSKKNNDSMPDAVWTIASSGDTDDVAADAESNAAAAKAKHIGMNPGSKVVYNLGPGSIVFGTLSLEMKDLTWESGLYSLNDDGSKNVFSYIVNTADTAAWVVTAVDQVRVGDDARGDIVERTSRAVIGEVNYQTGEVTIDLSKMQSKLYYYTYQHTDANGNPINRYSFDMIDESKSFVRIQYISEQTTTGYPKTFYLSDPDLNTIEKPSRGHLIEGENWFEAFVDMDGDGQYSAGEPYGFTRGVDIGWSGTEIDIALTDSSPVFGRLRFDGSGACTCDRVVLYGSEAAVNVLSNGNSSASGGMEDRVRIVRTKVNGNALTLSDASVVADIPLKLSVRPYITEADVLGLTGFDVEDLGSWLSYSGKGVSDIAYAVVFGDGSISSDLSGNRVAPYEIIRRVDYTRVIPKVVYEGMPTVFYGVSPAFQWTMDGYNSSHAFMLQIRDTAGKVVYDSGVRLAPRPDENGVYSWTPDVFVGDQAQIGSGVAVFANSAQYTWRVQMGCVKFGYNANAWSADSPQFRMNVNAVSEVNDSGYSSVKVAVKYFGAPEVLAKALDASVAEGKIRVEAFTSPDFTGAPVARGFFNAAALDSLSDDSSEPSVVLKGLASGSYYLRAYIDTDGDFEKDEWESWGYANRRDTTSSKSIFTPVPVTVGPDVAKAPEAVIYIEDADTDGDWLPDAWEWTTSSGSLTAKGPGNFYDGNVFSIKDDLQKKFTRMSASGSQVSANLRALTSSSIMTPEIMVLLGGVDTTMYASSTEAIESIIAPELVENGVTIESLEFVDGKVFIKVSAKTVPAAASDASYFYAYEVMDTLTVTCNVYVKTSLAEAGWKLAVSVPVTVGREAAEIDVGNVAEDSTGAFYRVELVK